MTISSPFRTVACARFVPALLSVVLFAACSAPPSPSTAGPDPGAEAPSDVAPPPAPGFGPRFAVTDNAGAVRFNGTVADEATRDALASALAAAYAGRATGDIRVDPNAHAAPWAEGIGPFLAGFDATGASLRFDGDTIELGGRVAPDDRERLAAEARRLFPGARLTGLFSAPDGSEAATRAFDALPANPEPARLEAALDAMDVRFEPGTARIDPASIAILSRAADVLSSLPGEPRIRIDAGGGPDGVDGTLARQRAEAIKVQLIVAGVGPARIETRGAGPGDAGASIRYRVVP